MARMLQALKNLEARSAWPAAKPSVLSHLAEKAKPLEPASLPPALPPPTPAPVAKALAAEPAPPVEPPAIPPPLPPALAHLAASVLFTAPAAIVVRSEERFDAPALDPVIVNTSFPRESAELPAPPAPQKRIVGPTGTRPPTGAERAVRRTLGEPHRRQPLADLASRLRRDAHKTGSHTLLLVGIGLQSATHETALHVATLLAEEGARVLLVDGDQSRRQLSAELDDLQERGLSNLSSTAEVAEHWLQPTAVQGLTFLPAGTERFSNLAESASDLARVFGQLAAGFDLTLVDGGRTGDPALSTLATLCDATYVVIQLGAVQATEAQQALRELRASGARVLGCIATGGDA